MKTFGVAKRVGYNSDEFYARKLYADSPPPASAGGPEAAFPAEHLDTVICQDSREMHQLPDNSVHLMITSPPYNVGKEYDSDLTLGDYRQMLTDVFRETFRVLVPGGRACINVANLGRKPYLPLHSLVIQEMSSLGFLMRGEIIWDKSASAGVSTAWGSWRSATNPTLRDVHEYILVFSKGSFQRQRGSRKNTITKKQFLDYTKSLWRFPAESARRAGHPAPFPVELPYRLIQLYTFRGDVVLDPFAGSGSTCLAALKAHRHYIGYEISRRYVRLSLSRIREQASRLSG